MKTVLFMHGGSGNHGCEAIIRTTSLLLGGPENLLLWSYNKEEDEKYGVASCFERIVVSEQIDKYSLSYFESLIQRRLLKNPRANLEIFLRNMFQGNTAISVGGDNYCYPWSARQAVELDRIIRKHAKRTILWGCSIDEASITSEIKKDLEEFDLITAREKITYELLKTINPNTIKVADPAFLLERIELPLPEGFQEGNTVGINISPLISDYASSGSIILENYRALIRFIINETDMSICLIPHVVWQYNNDYSLIQMLYEEFKDSKRVSYVEDGNCMELKGFISRCRFFVGARTHATIAAYSSFVPTLVVGYSVKSIGIARDLFGTEEGYVIPAQSLKTSNDLAKQFQQMLKIESDQKRILKEVIPYYKETAIVPKSILNII